MECHTEWREIAMQEPRWEQFGKQSPDSYAWIKTISLR